MNNGIDHGQNNEFSKSREVFWTIILAVVALHVLAAFVFGSIIIFQQVFTREAVFTSGPPKESRIEPRKLEYKIKMQQQQLRSGRPNYQPRITSGAISDVSMPDVKVDVTPIRDRIHADMKSSGVAGAGVSGFGSGRGIGAGTGLGLGASSVTLFGTTTVTERIAILVDVSPSMVQDEKGGVPGYFALKSEIARVINSLSPGTFFNIVFFGNKVDLFRSEMSLASDSNKEAAIAFMNSSYYLNPLTPEVSGIKGNYQAKNSLDSPNGGPTRTDWALSAAFEIGADAIFLISDGNHNIYKPPDMDYEQKVLKWEKDPRNLQRRKDYYKQQAEAARKRAKKGLPPKIVEGAGGPGGGSLERYTDKEVLEFLIKLSKEEYEEKGRLPPRVYCFGYVTSAQEETFMRGMSLKFNGRFKMFPSLVPPIKD